METTIVQGFYRVHTGIIGSPAVGLGGLGLKVYCVGFWGVQVWA